MISRIFCRIALITMLISIISCAEKIQPVAVHPLTCTNQYAIEYVLIAFSQKLIDYGIRDFTYIDINKALSIEKISIIQDSTSSEHVECRALISINYPESLHVDISNTVTDIERNEELRERLVEKLGVINGSGIYKHLIELLSNGPYGYINPKLDNKVFEKNADVISKNTKSLFLDRLAVPITYKVGIKKVAENRITNFYTFEVLNETPFNANVVILSLYGTI